MRTELDKERYSREFLEYQQTDNYKDFIAQKEAAKNSNGDPGKTMTLSTSKKSKKSKKKDYEHVLDVHDGRKGIFKCDLCESTFAKKNRLYRHTKKCHVENTDDQHCQICNKDFSVKNGLKYHNTLVHGVGIFKCDLCESTFSKKNKLYRHTKKCHVENTATHHCEICNKDFSKKRGLENHMKWHIKASHERTNEHYAQVHENKKDLVLSFKCNFCSSIFDLKGKLKLHIQAVHEKNQALSV